MPERKSASELEQDLVNAPGRSLDTGGVGGLPSGADLFGGPMGSDDANVQARKRAKARANAGSSMFATFLDGLFGGGMAQVDPETGATVGTGLKMDGRDGISSMEHLINRMSSLDAAQISYLQRRLYQGGFYGATSYTNSANIQWGLWDPQSMQALSSAIEQAGVNQVDNFDRFLDEQRIRFSRTGTNVEGRNVAGEIEEATGQGTVDIELLDPAKIQLMAESSAIELLGRKPTEQELSRITASLHKRQRESQIRFAESAASEQRRGQPDLSENAALLRGDRAFDLPAVDGQAPQLDREQATNVQVIMQVAAKMGLGDEYVLAAISAAIVESGLRNLGHGDRDSIGMYQQRNHYGTKAQRMDPYWSTQKFFEEALRYDGKTIGEWVANTQRPAKQYRGRYDEVMGQAVAIFAERKGGGPNAAAGAAAGRGRWWRGVPGPAERATATNKPGPSGPLGRGWDALTGAVRGAVESRPGLGFNGSPQRDPNADAPPGAFWLSSMLGSSSGDPVFREAYSVDPQAQIEMELRNSDPKAYETRRAAMKAVEFFSLLAAGGGHASG